MSGERRRSQTGATASAFGGGSRVKKTPSSGSARAAGSRRQTRNGSRSSCPSRSTRQGPGADEQTRTLDLSRSGASFLTARACRVGKSLRLAFLDLQNLPEGKRNIPAEVVRVGAPGPDHKKVVAVRFRSYAVFEAKIASCQ